MRAWPRPDLGTLPATPGVVRLHDSYSGERRPVQPTDGVARVYACGITPYDATHLGHAFSYLAVDTLLRTLLDAGTGVRYAQNVTDIDDPLLERATATGVDWEDLAADQIELYRGDLTALRLLPPDDLRGVVESMDEILAFLERMRAAGLIYQVPDPAHPDWYFGTGDLDLAALGMDDDEAEALFAERGGDPDRPGKRHPLDSLVWRQQRPGEPAWDSSLGRGRPGWHVECAAIATGALGAAFDVQAGGCDLAFPHHPMCALAAEELTGQPFARTYLHVGLVGLDGEKMSKSRGNLLFVSSMLAQGSNPMTLRLLLLAHHYRRDWEFSSGDLAEAEHRRSSWQQAFAREAGAPGEPVLAAVRAALRDDLDTPRALAAVDSWAQSGPGADAAAPRLVAAAVDTLLGIRIGRGAGAR
jgi:L-cysteine:1D-myo-inositol 2-amino-2-deoxy-alpha-D-glucopyranoside ligase